MLYICIINSNMLYASDKELTKTVPKVKAVCLADLN